MGFAAVADEVRKLALRAAQAARDTTGLIEESLTKSQEGSGPRRGRHRVDWRHYRDPR